MVTCLSWASSTLSYYSNAQPPDLECQKTLRFGLNLTSSLHILLTLRFCQLQDKYKSGLLSTFLEYDYESIGSWNWEKCLGCLHHWHCVIQVPECRTSYSWKKLVKLMYTGRLFPWYSQLCDFPPTLGKCIYLHTTRNTWTVTEGQHSAQAEASVQTPLNSGTTRPNLWVG